MRAFLTGPFGTWELEPGTTTIGRGSACTIRIKDRRLSRAHIQLRWDGDDLYIKDLGSSNGTLVNGDTLFGERKVKNRDLLIFGPVACDVYLGEHSFTNLPVLQIDANGRARAPVAKSPQAGLRPPSGETIDEDRMATEPGGHDTISDPDKEQSTGYTRQRTEAMDPDAITSLFPQNLPVDNPDINNPTTKQALTTRRRSPRPMPVDPAIRSAVDDISRSQQPTDESSGAPSQRAADESASPDDPIAPHTTDRLSPAASSVGTNSSALQPNRDLTPHGGPHVIADSTPPYEADDEQEDRQISTEVGHPHNQLEERQRAIETNASRNVKTVSSGLRRRVALSGLRLLAALLDGLQCIILSLLIALPWFVGGYTVGLLKANAALRARDGLPHFDAIEPIASWSDIVGSLLSSAGWEQLVTLSGLLREQSQQGFLAFFIGCVLAALALVVVLLLALIAPTTYRGGPFWHRRCGLVIVEASNGYFPTPIRSCLRWFLALVLLPIDLCLVIAGRRSIHDLLSGCDVRHQKYSRI